jgi:hypothetical protein
MLPVYKAISFDSIIKKGGRTKPWVVLVDTEKDVKPYVVKFFDTAEIEQRDCVANEVIGNVLAKEFDLPVPSAALIETDESFRMTITDPEAVDIYDQKDERVKFGTELLQGFNQMNPEAFTAVQVRKMIDIGMLFAYDNLIRNVDRCSSRKPNLLVKSDEAYLIDHELAFDITKEIEKEVETMQWNLSLCRSHIFFNYIQRSQIETKIHYFDEFSEYLKYLDLRRISPYFRQLTSQGFSNKKHPMIKEYLAYMRTNFRKFENALKGRIG